MIAADRAVLFFFMLFISVYFLESIGGFYMTSAIVSIEKQFQIPSKISGMLVSAGDFAYIPSVVFVAYLGSKGNRARWIGFGCTLIAIANILISSSNFLFTGSEVKLNTSTVTRSLERDIHRLAPNLTLAHFLAEISPAEKRQQVRHTLEQLGIPSGDDRSELEWLTEFGHCFSYGQLTPANDVTCDLLYGFLHKYNAPSQSEVTNWRMLSATSYAFCDDTLNSLRTMIDVKRCDQRLSSVAPTATIFLGMLILGVGRTMPFSLGLPLIDDNVRKSNLPLYFAGMFCIRIMGPMLGLMLGSLFNKQYFALGKVPYGMSPKDPMWIGRWWAGFLLIGCVLLLPSLALLFFRNPKQLSTEEADEKNGDQKQRPRGLALVDRHLEKGEDGEAIVPKGIMAKVGDFTQTMSTLIKQPVYRWAMAGRIIDLFAFKGFYIFLPKYLELQFGIPQYEVNRLMAVIGVSTFSVGVLIGSFVMRAAKLQGRKAAAWVALTGAIAACFSLLNSSVGCTSTMTALGESLAANVNVTNSCALECHCESAPLYPVCDLNGTVFLRCFSYYSPCHAGCKLGGSAFGILETHKMPVFDSCQCSATDRVSREFCQEENCRSKMYWYFTNVAISGIIGGMGVVPGILIMLRSVPPKHRSISLGFNGFLGSLLATLPSPIAWGTIIDHFCLFWSQKCGERGACALYATDGLRFWLHFVYGGLRIVSLITDLFVVYHAVGLKLTDSENDDDAGGREKQNDGQINEATTKANGKQSGVVMSKLLVDQEQATALLAPNGGGGCCEDNARNSAETPIDLHKSASLPRGVNPGAIVGQQQPHRRSVSRDMSIAAMLVPKVSADELQSFRKSSNQFGGPIAEF